MKRLPRLSLGRCTGFTRFPTVRQQLLKELQALDGPLDPSVLFRLPYLNAVCCETLRIYPVGMLTFPRVTRSRLELMGSSLEPGTIVVGCIYLAITARMSTQFPMNSGPNGFWNAAILLLNIYRLVGASGVALAWRLPNSR